MPVYDRRGDLEELFQNLSKGVATPAGCTVQGFNKSLQKANKRV